MIADRPAASRQAHAVGVIVIAVCAGVAHFVAAPALTRAEHAEQQALTAQNITAEIEQLRRTAAERNTNVLEWQAFAELVSRASAHASDAAQLNAAIGAAAADVGVLITRIAPGDGRPAAASRGEEANGIILSRTRIECEGHYAQLTQFIEALLNDTGMVKLESARFSPIGRAGDPRLRLQVELTHAGLKARRSQETAP